MVPGVDVLGTPGWLTPLVLLPVVEGEAGAMTGGVAGDTPGVPAGDPAVPCAIAAAADAVKETASALVRSHFCCIGNSGPED